MGGGIVVLYLFLLALGLWIQFVIVRWAVYRGIERFLKEASRAEDRGNHPVPRRLDALVAHLAEVARKPRSD